MDIKDWKWTREPKDYVVRSDRGTIMPLAYSSDFFYFADLLQEFRE